MVPVGVNQHAIDEDVGPAITGQLVGLGVIAVEAVCRVGVEEGVDVLDDHGFGVDPPGAHIVEGPAVLGFEVLLRIGIVLPGRPMVGNRDLGSGIAGEVPISVLRGDVIGGRRQVLLGGPGGGIGTAHHHIVRGVAWWVRAVEDAASTAG